MMIIKVLRYVAGQGWGYDVSPEYEELGLDLSDHGERAYDIEPEDDEVIEEVKVAKLCALAADGDIEGCLKLVKMGIRPDMGDVDGRTALHIAAGCGHVDLVEVFVKKLDVNI